MPIQNSVCSCFLNALEAAIVKASFVLSRQMSCAYADD